MDRQKVIPPVSTKITRKLASESSDHKDLMNYYSNISRDETGAPMRWKMSSHVHEEVLPGRLSPAIAKVARSRSNSRDSSSERKKVNVERKKLNLENLTNKLVSCSKRVLPKVSSKRTENESQTKKLSIAVERTNSTKTTTLQNAGSTKGNKRGRRPKSELFVNTKLLKTKNSEPVKLKAKSVSTSEKIVTKQRGRRPGSLDLQSDKAEALLNGDEEYFKSPHPLTPCNIIVKRKKGRPKETPPTLEPEPSVSPKTQIDSETILTADPVLNQKVVRRPGRPPKNVKKTDESSKDKIDKFSINGEITSENKFNLKPVKGKQPKCKPLEKGKICVNKVRKINFKGKPALDIKKIGKSQQGNMSEKVIRKGGRPPGSKNKPKPAVKFLESRLRSVGSKLEVMQEGQSEKTKVHQTGAADAVDTVTDNVIQKQEMQPNSVEPVKDNHISTVDETEIKMEGISDNKDVKLDKIIKAKDPLHKRAVRTGRIKPKSKVLKDSKTVQNVKKKRILTSQAKKHMDSAIAHLPENDLRRKLQQKLLERLSGKSNRNYSQEVAAPNDEFDRTEKDAQVLTIQMDEKDTVHSFTSSETQNLSVLVERQRFPKAKKDSLVANSTKKGRPKRQLLDVYEYGRVSDNESVCSELSSFSLASNSSAKKCVRINEDGSSLDVNEREHTSKTAKKPDLKRKYTSSEDIMKVIEKCAKLEPVVPVDTNTVHDFEPNQDLNKKLAVGENIGEKNAANRNAQLTARGRAKPIGRTIFKGTNSVVLRKQRNINILKKLKTVKFGKKARKLNLSSWKYGINKKVRTDVKHEADKSHDVKSINSYTVTGVKSVMSNERMNEQIAKRGKEILMLESNKEMNSKFCDVFRNEHDTKIKYKSEEQVRNDSDKMKMSKLQSEDTSLNSEHINEDIYEKAATGTKVDIDMVERIAEIEKTKKINLHDSVYISSSDDKPLKQSFIYKNSQQNSKQYTAVNSGNNSENNVLETADSKLKIETKRVTEGITNLITNSAALNSNSLQSKETLSLEADDSSVREKMFKARDVDSQMMEPETVHGFEYIGIEKRVERNNQIAENDTIMKNAKADKSGLINESKNENENEIKNENTIEVIVSDILNNIIHKACKQPKDEGMQKNDGSSRIIDTDCINGNIVEKSTYVGNILEKETVSAPDQVFIEFNETEKQESDFTVLNAHEGKEYSENNEHSENSNINREELQIRKPISNSEIMRRRRKRRIREKKSNTETGDIDSGFRKIALRQKISRSPLDNIALKQSIEENEYMQQQMKKTLKRGPKPKSKQSPIAIQEQEPVVQSIIEESSSLFDGGINDNNLGNVEEEYEPVPAITLEDLKKTCKPCSVRLKDFLKQLQRQSNVESDQDFEESSMKHELENKDVNETLKEELETSEIIESIEGVENNESRELVRKDVERNSENEELVKNISMEHTCAVENQLGSQEREKRETSISLENFNTIAFDKSSSCETDVNYKANKSLTKFTKQNTNIKNDETFTSKNDLASKAIGPEVTKTRRKPGPKKGQRKAVNKLNVTAVKPKVIGPNRKRKGKNMQNETKSDINLYADKSLKVVSYESGEQTARKTVPPLKIKLQGGLTSKTKMYTVESALETKPKSVDSVIDGKPKKKYKSKSKSDSESEKHKSRHHHTKKRNKSPEASTAKKGEKKVIDSPKSDSLKANDPYEANFLEFIQQQEKNETAMASWRSSVVSKASHQLVGGKACKSGADGSLTVSACALADTMTSSVTSEQFVTVSKSTGLDNKISEVSKIPLTEQSWITASSDNLEKKSDLEHFQQTEMAVGNLVSKISCGKLYCCNHCDFSCDSQNEILEHTKCVHKDELLYSCSICHKVTFKTKQAILAHFAGCHEGMKESYICLPDFYERHGESKGSKSPPDNIFDRMSNLFDIQSTKIDSPIVTNSSAIENTVASKTAAEADSTTTALDESDIPSSTVKAATAEDEPAEQVSSAADQDLKKTQAESTACGALNKEDNTDADIEMNIKIVDVVSLKDQGGFDSENSVDESVTQAPSDSIASKLPTSVTVSVNKHSELKVPFYPLSQTSKSMPVRDTTNTTVNLPVRNTSNTTVNQVKPNTGKVGTTYKCEACHVHAPVLAALVAHLKSSHTNILKLFQCPYCRDMEGENEAMIHQHIRHCHPTDNPNPPVALSEPAKRNLKTLTIKLPEKTESTVIERDIYMCLRCKEHLPSLEMIYNHLEAEHLEVFVYVCPFCKVFKAKEEHVVNNHVLSAHRRSVEDISISLAIDGTQFVRVASLIKDKGMRSVPKQSHSQSNKPQTELHQSPKQPVPNLTIPFHQNMAPLHPVVRPSSAQVQHNLVPQHTPPVRAPQLQGAKKRKATLSESIAQLTMQRQLQQAKQEANKLATNTEISQPNMRPAVQQPPPLLRGPPPLIRYDQLNKVSASLIAAQQYLQSGKSNSKTVKQQVAQNATSNIIGQMTLSAAQRLQSLNNPQSHSNQISSTPRPIQSALFDTSDQNTFLPASRRQSGPVLNIPQITRTANKTSSQQDSQPVQRNALTGSPLDLSNKSTPEPSPLPQAVQSPPADGKSDEINPEAFKIFNLKPATPVQQPQTNIVPQFVRPNTTSTLAYRPTTPHVANIPMSAVNMVPISLASVSLQNLPQFVRVNFPQALQQVVTPQTPQQVVIPQSLQQVITPQSLQQIVSPQSLQQLVTPQSLQQLVIPQSANQLVSPQSSGQQVTSQPVQQVITPQSVEQVVAALSVPKGLPAQTNVNTASTPVTQIIANKAQKTKEGTPLPMFKCPYCPQVVELRFEEVQPHIEEIHPGSTVVLTPL